MTATCAEQEYGSEAATAIRFEADELPVLPPPNV